MKQQIQGLVNLISDTDLLILGEKERFTKNVFNNHYIIDYIKIDIGIDTKNMYFKDIFNEIWRKINAIQMEVV